MHEYFLDGVVGTHCYFQIGVFEQVGDISRLFACVGECGPFLCRCGFQFVGVVIFLRWGLVFGGLGNALLNMMLWIVFSSVMYS